MVVACDGGAGLTSFLVVADSKILFQAAKYQPVGTRRLHMFMVVAKHKFCTVIIFLLVMSIFMLASKGRFFRYRYASL